MVLLNVRSFFGELCFCSLLIAPLMLLWLVMYVILKVKKYDNNVFFYKFHKYTGIILFVAFFMPIAGSLISNFCPGEQKTFQSYEYFVSVDPARTCTFADDLPEDDLNIKYYCYHEPLQIGKIVGVRYIFEQENVAKAFLEERTIIWDKEYSEREYITYYFDKDGLSFADVNEDELRKYLAELSDLSLEEYKVLLYYEDNYGQDHRWILYSDNHRELIELVSEYASW